MNEELLDELSDAMKRRDKALAGRARWQEQLEDAEEDIRELSARITEATEAFDASETGHDTVDMTPPIEPATWAWSGEQEPAQVQE